MPLHIPFTAKLVVPQGVLVRDLQGESVVLNLQTEKYFGLDEVGSRMWAVLTTADSIQAGYELLLGEYDVEPERLRADVEQLLSQLLDHGLVDLSG
jgi:hypothetical protein